MGLTPPSMMTLLRPVMRMAIIMASYKAVPPSYKEALETSIPVKAHITDQIPKGGHYRYKTNPNMTGNWLIGGSMKVNRVLTDKEVAKINKAAGLADLPRAQPFKAKKFGFAKGGTVAPDEWKAEAYVNHMADGGPVPPLRPLSPQLTALREQMAQQSALNKAYDEAMKNVYTNQMPTFAQWLASQGKAKGGKVSREEHDANLAKFLAESKVKGRMYHGTAHYAKTPEATDKLTSTGIKRFRKKSVGTFLSPDADLAEYTNTRGGLQGAVYPVYTQVKNPFDFDNPEHIAALSNQTKIDPEGVRHLLFRDTDNWQTLEEPYMQRAIKQLGHDAYYTLEDGRKNLAVYDPRKIKSAIGNRGTYDTSKSDMTKAKGGAIKPVGYTKEQITVSPNLDAMRYELMSVKHYSKKVK